MVVTGVALAMLVTVAASAGTDLEQQVATSRQVVKTFATSLKSELKAALEAGVR